MNTMFSRLTDRVKSLFGSTESRSIESRFAESLFTVTSGKFVKGINFGGDRLTIQGESWLSFEEALAEGLSVSGIQSATTQVKIKPKAEPEIAIMLNSVIYKPQTLEITQDLPNGNYEIYLWILENYKTYWHALEISIGNECVATDVGKLALGRWQRYGGYGVAIENEPLHVTINTNNPKVDAHIMGMSIFQVENVPFP